MQTGWAAAGMPAASVGGAVALRAERALVQTMHFADERSLQAGSSLTAPDQQVSGTQPSLEPSGKAKTCASALLKPSAAAATHPEVAGRSQQHMAEQTSVAALAAAASVTGAASNENPHLESASSPASQAVPASWALPPAGARLPAALEQLQELARTPTAALQPASALGSDAPHEGPSTRVQCHKMPPAATSTLRQAEERGTAGIAGSHMRRRRPSLLRLLCPGSAASKPACTPASGHGACHGAPSAPRAVQEASIPGAASHRVDASARRASTPRASAAAAWLSAAFARAWAADGVEAGAAAAPSASGRRRRSALAGSDEDAAVNPGHAAQAPSGAAQSGPTVSPAAASAPASRRAEQWRAGGSAVPRMQLLPPGEGWRPLLGRSGVPRPGGRAASRLVRWQPSAPEAGSAVRTERPGSQRAASTRPPPGSPPAGLALPASVAALEALAQS